MTLTAIGLLAHHLTADNHRHLIDAARRKSKREIEQLVATLRPQPSVPSVVRKLPQRGSEHPCVSVETCAANQGLTSVPTVKSSVEGR
jgi:hypothetical protein